MRLVPLAIALLATAAPFALPAQDMTPSADEQVLLKQVETNKREVFAQNLKLTDAESKAFWPIYDEYEAKSKKLADRYVAMINEFAAKYDTLTDAEAQSMLTERLAIEKHRMDLKQEYTKKIAKALPGKKALRYAQLESRIDNLTNRNIYTIVPLAR
jgi:Spy/CpxP family protein refolding chaperone